ncbi:hypothetical protein [Gordonia westfalica]|uniref:hypothetical protein n=1 Tax=Gordonia westfalica TaxID=158898 RepID=UPI00287BC396|nr:hypothetical protein [Gordonia westfalica]
MDGFNVIPVTTLGDWASFADEVVPTLRDRGLIQSEYEPGSLRHKVLRSGDLVDAKHPAAGYRGQFAGSTHGVRELAR